MVDGEEEMVICSYLDFMDLMIDLFVYIFYIKLNVVCKGRMLCILFILFFYIVFLIK